jgi:hypothetical protein
MIDPAFQKKDKFSFTYDDCEGERKIFSRELTLSDHQVEMFKCGDLCLQDLIYKLLIGRSRFHIFSPSLVLME